MCASLSGSSRTKLPSSVNGSGMAGGHAGRRGGSVPAAVPAGGPPAPGVPTVAVGTTKSRWRTSTNAHSAPTKATTAPMSIRWFRVAEKPTW